MEIRTSDILEAMQVLSTKQSALKIPPAPPAPKSISRILGKAAEKNVGASILVSMCYKSLSGNEKERDVLIRRVIHNKKELFIDGVAMDIRAPRLIKVSQISKIVDVGSGHIYDNPYQFLQNKLGIEISNDILPETLSDFAKAIARTNSEITVLMYLVSIDGIRDKRERQAVFDYVKNRTQDLNYSDEELNEYLISVAPDEESCMYALHATLNKDKETVQTFIGGMLKVITADGKIHTNERAFLVKIIDLLEKEGFDITLPV